MDSAVIFYSSLLCAVLFGQWYRNKSRKLVDVKFAWSVFFLGMVFNTSSFILADFYIPDEPYNTLFVKAGYVSLMLALAAFFFTVERIVPYETHHVFSLSGFGIAALTILSPRSLMEFLALSIAMVTFVGIMMFLVYTLRNTTGEVRRGIEQLVTGFLIGFVGFLGRSDFVFYNLGTPLYILGSGMLVGGLMIFGYAIVDTPALDELDWKRQLVELYLIQSGGLLVYHRQFSESRDVDQVLTAAGISGVQSLFQEITSSESGLNVVSIGDYEILFAHGVNFTCVLIARAAYQVLLGKVREFTEKFDGVFGPIVESFEGSLKEFSSARELVDSYF
ncbi:MAG: hypothetical protein JSW05_10020 [Candidatus Thorarchaeota archaeon]|nr:MAG: hypothetical protein JSW05_10020 [Candidatus Thorarchaeota archaeon]